jgi:hypothetical protein
MRLPTLLLAIALPAPLFAADSPPPGEDLFPLAVGNTWTYRVQPFQEDRFVVRVARNEMVGEQTCFVLEGRLRDRVTGTEHVAFTKDGLTRFRADKEDIVPPVTILKPAAPKSPWKTDYQLGERRATATFSQEPGTVLFQGKRLGATIAHGEMGGQNGAWVKTTVWYAAGIGMVRQQIEEPKRAPLVLELEKFEKGE